MTEDYISEDRAGELIAAYQELEERANAAYQQYCRFTYDSSLCTFSGIDTDSMGATVLRFSYVGYEHETATMPLWALTDPTWLARLRQQQEVAQARRRAAIEEDERRRLHVLLAKYGPPGD